MCVPVGQDDCREQLRRLGDWRREKRKHTDTKPMPWTIKGELSCLGKGQYLDNCAELQEDVEVLLSTTPWDMEHDANRNGGPLEQNTRRGIRTKAWEQQQR